MGKICGDQYERPGGREPGDRIVECGKLAGHKGEHQEEDTEVAWPVEPRPSPSREVRINLPLDILGENTSVMIGGQEMKHLIHGLTLRAEAHHLPVLELELAAFPIEVNGVLRVVMSGATRALLVNYGWTPPAEVEAPRQVEPT